MRIHIYIYVCVHVYINKQMNKSITIYVYTYIQGLHLYIAFLLSSVKLLTALLKKSRDPPEGGLPVEGVAGLAYRVSVFASNR